MSVDIEVSPALLNHLRQLLGCHDHRRLNALASELITKALEEER